MKQSLKGGWLPESEAEFEQLRIARGAKVLSCSDCGAGFSSANTHSAAGWRDTQIVGMCEDCFDALHEEPEDLSQPASLEQVDSALGDLLGG